MKVRIILFIFFFIIANTTSLFSCTIFYTARDDMVFSGNNEDCSDPNTYMTFYPSETGKLGWVKFGFQSGFPQGGMNESGLFWDAASTPYLPMPYSEENKEKYNGVLMQKVIEECSTAQEAVAVFEEYYCDDLYNAQYLIGDSTGTSIIVEGDEIFGSIEDFQVMTNFIQSQYEPSNYPCWRYDTVTEILQNSDDISEYLFGSILSETHQGGNYLSQYSNIYDNKNCLIYLFYFHNYEEYIVIDLDEELQIGHCSYHIPSLFSKVEMIYPGYGSIIDSTSVTFRWKGKETSIYELYYSTDPDFTDCDPLSSTSSHIPGYLGICLFGSIFVGTIFKRRSYLIFILILFVIFSLQSCSKESTSPSETDIIEFTQTVQDLLPGTTYYWKIFAHPEGTDEFFSETITYSFSTIDR